MNQIHFAQIREDSLVERQLNRQFHPRTIVTIGSGGCTALSLLQDGVTRVYAIDQNEAQAALIECKKAAIQALSREEFLSFIGEKEATDRLETYRKIAPLLPDYARQYWDSHLEDIAIGVNQCGTTERFYRFIGQNIRLNVYGDEVWQKLFACRSVDEQIAFAEQYLNTESWRTAVRLLLSKTTHLQFFPAYMFANARENDFGAFFASMFLRELQSRLVSNNYFLSQLLFASYLYDQPEGLPHYLSESGYAEARRNLHKLTVVPLSLQQALPALDGVDAFYLSNVFDWADQAACKQICTAMLQAKADTAVVLYRNMLSTPPLPDFFGERLREDEPLSREMAALERSMMYQKISVGVLT